jgi:hypothetical protein
MPGVVWMSGTVTYWEGSEDATFDVEGEAADGLPVVISIRAPLSRRPSQRRHCMPLDVRSLVEWRDDGGAIPDELYVTDGKLGFSMNHRPTW